MPCEHGTIFSNHTNADGKTYCDCNGTPFNGTLCSNCMCQYNGSCSMEPTTPFKSNSKYGCKCTGKRFGNLCEQCNTIDDDSKNETCNSTCKTNYFGKKCDNVCFANLKYFNNNSICNFIRSVGGECNTCHGHGKCVDGKCKCNKNWYHDRDNNLECVKTCKGHPICSGHGTCEMITRNPSCLCDKGWHGPNCNVPCPGMITMGIPCNNKGKCNVDVDKRNATCKCNEKFRGKDCRIECPGKTEACDGYGTCDGNGICHCKPSAGGLCIASLFGAGDGECMGTRKAYRAGGCSSKTDRESCSITNSRGDNCCQWKCTRNNRNNNSNNSNTTNFQPCIQLKKRENRVNCSLIVDEEECLRWRDIYNMKICDWNASVFEKNDKDEEEEEEEQTEHMEITQPNDEYDNKNGEEDDIEVIDPDAIASDANDESALVTIKELEPERIMENCKPRGKNLPPKAPLRIGILERTSEECNEKFSKAETINAEINYVAYFYKNCSVFDAFYEEKVFKISPNNMYFVKGFTQGLIGMCEGEIRRVTVPSKLGYGKHDAAYIPGNSTLVYEIEMLKLENPERKKKT